MQEFVNVDLLQGWLSRMILGSLGIDESEKIQENRLQLQSLASFIVKDKS